MERKVRLALVDYNFPSLFVNAEFTNLVSTKLKPITVFVKY